ncbi:MAG: hypothetical protein HY460_01865 [Parcubacteria group bacterium]|nr:hypothetical protein [Parcubacteria group bacterium]
MRRALLGTAVLAFLIISPIIISYSRGLRFDLAQWSVRKTGAIFVSTRHRDARISIDDTLSRDTSLFTRSVLFSGLFPQSYKVHIRKDGYHDWEKALPVKEGFVTEVFDVILIRKDLRADIVLARIENFWVSPDDGLVAFTRKTALTPSPAENPPQQPYMLELHASAFPPRATSPIATFPESASITRFLIDPGNEYGLTELHTPTSTRVILQPLARQASPQDLEDILRRANAKRQVPYAELRPGAPPAIPAFEWHPRGNLRLYILKESSLFLLDIGEEIVQKISSRSVRSFSATRNRLIIIESTPSRVVSADLNGGERVELTQPLEIPGEKLFADESGIAFTDTEQTLWFIAEGGAPLRVSDRATHARFSADDKKLLYWNDRDVGVFYLAPWYLGPNVPYREPLTSESIYSGEGIQDAVWYPETSSHIMLLKEKKILFSELDGRDRRNIYTLADPQNARALIYRQDDERAYYQDGDALSAIPFPF